MKYANANPLPLLAGLPAGSAVAEDLLGHYVEQWLAMDERTGPTPANADLSAAGRRTATTAKPVARGVRSASIVPDVGDIIPDSGQWNSGQ